MKTFFIFFCSLFFSLTIQAHDQKKLFNDMITQLKNMPEETLTTLMCDCDIDENIQACIKEEIKGESVFAALASLGILVCVSVCVVSIIGIGAFCFCDDSQWFGYCGDCSLKKKARDFLSQRWKEAKSRFLYVDYEMVDA